MPRALDSQQLTITHSPTQRIDFNNAKQGFPAFDPVALVTQWTKFLEDYGLQIISDITGIDLTTLQSILDPLIEGLELVTEALNALTSGDPTQWLAFFTHLGSLNLLESFPDLLTGLLSGAQGVNVLSLFGTLPTTLFGLIPASSIGSTSPNLLPNGGFDGSVSLSAGGGWSWDSTEGHTSPGSAKTTANSTLRAVLSTPVSVAVGQKLTPSVWFKTLSYTGSGTPIRLMVRTYLAGVVVGTTTIQSTGASPSWAQLTGTYTVPSGVDAVRLRLVVDTTATGGTVWFDDGSLTKPGNGPFDGILDLFNLSSLDDLFSLNPATIWTAIINLFLKPSGLLASLVGGFLPDSQRPQLLQDTIDSVVNVFQSGSFGSSTGNPLATFFDSMFGIHKTGSGAQAQNVVQDTQIGSLLSGGSGLFDTMDGAASTTLNTTNWEQTYSGSGAGTCGLSGKGTATWNTSGATARLCQNRYKTALTTDTQLVQVILTSNIGASLVGNNPSLRIQGRENSTHDTYVEARITANSAEIGYVVSGTYTRLGSTVTISGNTSGTWQFKLGTVSSNREFVLLLNNVTVVSQTDSGAASQLGASYRYAGFTHSAGVQWIPGTIIFFQLAAPDVDSFGCSDRLAAL